MRNRFYDLHCDTATKAYAMKTTLENEILHINKHALKCFDEVKQVFAVFYDDKRTDPGTDFFFKVKNLIEKETADAENITPIISCEGGNITEGKLENIILLAENGVKFFSLVWNGVSCFATGAKTDQNEGITELGKDCIKELENCGIVLDVSHLSDKGFYDIERLSKKTFVATHSNSRAVCNNGRNLTEDQIKTIIERKGLIGLNLNPPFLTEKGEADFEDILKHIENILELGGVNVLALGGDLDGISSLPKGITSVADIIALKKYLTENLGIKITEKILYENANDFFNEHIY